ncbi:MAG: FtsQ-type POTRA domain-containing protein [Bdellovibrionales bacterium]|nr:FtsQ-type POTRA domain-containing protein [Bdellovibrionales bacterium]
MRDLNRLILILTTFLFLGLLLFVSDKNYFKLQNISISQVDESTRDWIFKDIKSKINLDTKAYIGKYVWEIDLKDLMETVEKDKRVNKVQIKRKFPNELEVKVLAHEPIALFYTKDGSILPIARDGDFMPQLKKGEFIDAPIMRDVVFYKDLSKRKKAIEIILTLKEENPLSSQKVSEILFDKKQGFSLILTPEAEIVRLGFDNFEKKIGMAKKVFSYMQSKGLKGRVIDVRFSKKVVVRLRNAP